MPVYSNFGKGKIPPLPVHLILTDRDDGTLWRLIHVIDPPADDGLGYIGITDNIPDEYTDRRTYKAFSGPILGPFPHRRMLVRGGYLGFEFIVLPGFQQDQDQARILTRRLLKQETRDIISPTDLSRAKRTLAWADASP